MSNAVAVVEVSLDERIRRINEIDLEPIKFKLVHDSDTEWTIERVDKVAAEYKRFLALILKNTITNRVQSIVPIKEVDEFWHAHILDTAKYVEDCQSCLGFFLHHFPYLGLRGPDDAQALKDRFRESREYYLAEFGEVAQEDRLEVSADCGTSDCGTSDCAPEPSCSGEPDPKVMSHYRPTLARA